ncbi:MAG: hypothetical protein U5P10_00145 [Spirochaetia bacterium]|nr:hypothetical protein [Spirochaetia bacterium]
MNKGIVFLISVLIFFTASILLAEEFSLEGNWVLYGFDTMNTTTGEIEWKEVQEYEFMDGTWVRIGEEEFGDESPGMS